MCYEFRPYVFRICHYGLIDWLWAIYVHVKMLYSKRFREKAQVQYDNFTVYTIKSMSPRRARLLTKLRGKRPASLEDLLTPKDLWKNQ